jgi:hypothetical protein
MPLSLFPNAWEGYALNARFDRTGLTVAVVIAASSVLQAGVAGTSLRRALGDPVALDNARDLGRFVLLSPLLLPHRCNLVALRNVDPGSTAGIGIRVELDHVVGRRHAGCAPNAAVALVLAGEPRALWRNRAFPVAVPMLLFFALFVAISHA